ncbi:MAG TPA: hypothetical protein VFN38_01720, partial [Gemmatimonadaceae bacterium]|nr:hypothetical protein [Gemmatimonadaceae bacterium]
GSVESAIHRYARGIESQAVDKLKEAYPGLTDEQQKAWEMAWAKATRLKATVADLKVTGTDGDQADADFQLNVTYEWGDGSRGVNPPQRQHAQLRRTPNGWQLVSVR